MTPEAGETPWPVAIYLETNILVELPLEIATAEFLRLRELCTEWAIALLIPELCADELIHRRERQVADSIGRAEAAVATLSKFAPNPPSLVWGASKAEITGRVAETVRTHLVTHGVRVIPTPAIELPRLLNMAVKKIRPFEEKGEKGFRDSVILFSVLEYARQWPHAGYHLLISRDDIFSHADVVRLASEHGVDFRVRASIAETIEHLEQFLSDAAKRYRAERVGNLLAFLEQNRDRIEEHIRTTGEFTSNFLLDRLIVSGSLKEIEAIHLLAIEDAQPGVLPNGVERGNVQISFRATMKFVVILSAYAAGPMPTYRVGQPETPSPPVPFLIGEQQLIRQALEKIVFVQGTANLDALSDAYSDLELAPVHGSSLVDVLLSRT